MVLDLLAFLVWARGEFIGWLAVPALDIHLHTHLAAADRLRGTIVGWVGLSSPVTALSAHASDVVYYLLVAMAATPVLVTGWLVLRAPHAPEPRSVEDELAL